jgi:hypothetical protein
LRALIREIIEIRGLPAEKLLSQRLELETASPRYCSNQSAMENFQLPLPPSFAYFAT